MMKFKLDLSILITVISFFSYNVNAQDLEINLICSFSAKTEIFSFKDSLKPSTYKDQMGVRIERVTDPQSGLFVKVETLGPKNIQFVIWVPYSPSSKDTPLESNSTNWTTKAYNRSTETLLDYSSFSSGQLGSNTGETRMLAIDRITGVMQGTVINNYKSFTESTEFNGLCKKSDTNKQLF